MKSDDLVNPATDWKTVMQQRA